MKKTRLLLLAVVVLTLGSLLSSCLGAGAATTVQIWPGLMLDAKTQIGYVAHQNRVYAVDLTNGQQKWRYPEQPERNLGFSAPPALTADGQLIAGAYNKSIYSLNPQSAQLNWQNQDAGNRYYAGALTIDSDIFAPNIDHSIYAVNNKGSQLWKFTTQNALWSTPATDGKTIYLTGMDHMVYALDAKTGKLIWQTGDLGGSIAGTPALSSDGKLYVGTFSNLMIALDATNGKVIWQQPVVGWVYGGPLLHEGVLYFGDLSGTFYAKDAVTGKDIWTPVRPDTSDKSEITGTPVVINDTVYFGSEAGVIYAYDIANGQMRWSSLQKSFGNTNGKTTLGKLYAPLHAIDNTIYFTQMGTGPILVAIDTDGNQKWSFTPSK